jgi:hypothetical protein
MPHDHATLRARLPRARGLGWWLWHALRTGSRRGLVVVAVTLLTFSGVSPGAAQERGSAPGLAGSGSAPADSTEGPHPTVADPGLAALFAVVVRTADVVVTGERGERLADGADVTAVEMDVMQEGALLLAMELTCTLSGCFGKNCRRSGCQPVPAEKPTGCSDATCTGTNCTECNCTQAIKVIIPHTE